MSGKGMTDTEFVEAILTRIKDVCGDRGVELRSRQVMISAGVLAATIATMGKLIRELGERIRRLENEAFMPAIVVRGDKNGEN